MDVLDRVFGACFRTWSIEKECENNRYIDYIPKKKWKYSDHNLMRDLKESETFDVLALSDDPNGGTPDNIQLRLHDDNIFMNPLNQPEEVNERAIIVENCEGNKEVSPAIISHVTIEENNNIIGDQLHDEDRQIILDKTMEEKCNISDELRGKDLTVISPVTIEETTAPCDAEKPGDEETRILSHAVMEEDNSSGDQINNKEISQATEEENNNITGDQSCNESKCISDMPCIKSPDSLNDQIDAQSITGDTSKMAEEQVEYASTQDG